MPMCCRHVGPAPEFTPLADRGMRLMELDDTFHCYGCNRMVRRLDYGYDDSVLRRPWCVGHGRMTLLVNFMDPRSDGYVYEWGCTRQNPDDIGSGTPDLIDCQYSGTLVPFHGTPLWCLKRLRR